MIRQKFKIRFSGITVAFESDFPLTISQEFQPFLVDENVPAKERYRLCLQTSPQRFQGEEIHSIRDLQVLQNGLDRTFLFPLMKEEAGVPACIIRHSGEHEVWIPTEFAKRLQENHKISGSLFVEQLLLNRDALLFHSSVVSHEGKVILFSGPSGIGKSTQADLWQAVYGAKILNGDRCILRIGEDAVLGGGSPWCGSSGIYDPDYGTVEAIVLLRQGKENILQPADPRVAFRELYQQCVMHPYDIAFVEKACDLLTKLCAKVPVYTLQCLPEESAVRLCYEGVFKNKT